MSLNTEQETFWEGDFGNDYTDRNKDEFWVASNLAFFGEVFRRTHNIQSVLELGSNIGLNLMAIKHLLPSAELSAVEINKKAALELKGNLPDVDIHLSSILEFQPSTHWDLAFSKGVLIHIHPEKLPMVYKLLYKSSSRYILIAEYYNPRPIGISYRGHENKLFKRDFAGEMLAMFPKLSLVDYGFCYHRDPNFPQDDLTWFLMEKAGTYGV
jgi:pseudaminic acid biosynthesis-associated methylase